MERSDRAFRSNSSPGNDPLRSRIFSIRESNTTRIQAMSSALAKDSNYNFLSIIPICVGSKIPIMRMDSDLVGDTELPAKHTIFATMSNPPSDQVASLGSGLTSEVIQYVTQEKDEVKLLLPPETTVALKVFHSRKTSNQSERQAIQREVHDSVMREINVLTHPRLLSHPNLVKLLFVGWQPENLYPALGMEFGSYGSLEHIIKTLRPKPSILQMRNITVDIALGLYTLHSAGFSHGDLKPDNVVIMKHEDPTRGIIAKIADFGGSAKDHDKPMHFTPLWAAPEVINRDADIDWKKADVYSFGLVIGSLWASRHGEFFDHIQLKQTSCFLSDQIDPTHGIPTEDLLFLFKSSELAGKILSICLKTFPDKALQMEILELAKKALQPNFWRRPDAQELLFCLDAFALKADRDILNEKTATRGANEQLKYKEEAFVMDHLIETLDEGRKMILQQFRLAMPYSDKPVSEKKCVSDIPSDLPAGLTDDEFLFGLLHELQRIIPSVTSLTTGRRLNIFFEEKDRGGGDELIAFLIKEFETSIESKGEIVQRLQTAALQGHSIGLATFATMGNHKEGDFPARLFLSLLALARSTWAMQILSNRWPSYVRIIRRILRDRRCDVNILAGEEARSNIQSLLAHLISYITQREPRQSRISLEEALSTGAVDDVRRILEAEADEATLLVKEAVPTLLYQFSTLTDEEAAPLAWLVFDQDSRLDVLQSIQAPIACEGRYRFTCWLESLSPLSAAIRQGKINLALEILNIHIKYQKPLVDFSAALGLSFIYYHHEIAQALLLLAQDYPALSPWEEKPLIPEEDKLHGLIILVYLTKDHVDLEWERRAFHAGGYTAAYSGIIEVLVREIMHSSPQSSESAVGFLHEATQKDDLTAVKILVQSFWHPESNTRGCPALNLEEDTLGKLLLACIVSNAFKCFEYLVEQFPEIANEETYDFACMESSRSDFIRLLLKSGISVMGKGGHATPLFVALHNGDLESTEAIASFCTENQLQEFLSNDVSIFLSILSRWGRVRGPEILNSIRWLIEHDGTRVTDTYAEETPYWRYILADEPRPCSRRDQLLDVELLNMLLDVPELYDAAQTTPCGSLSIIHSAVSNAHYEVVKMLIERDFNFNAICIVDIDSPPGGKLHLTALDISVTKYVGVEIPKQISDLGYIESQKWLDDLLAISALLEEKGGKYSHYTNMEGWKSNLFSNPRMRELMGGTIVPPPFISSSVDNTEDIPSRSEATDAASRSKSRKRTFGDMMTDPITSLKDSFKRCCLQSHKTSKPEKSVDPCFAALRLFDIRRIIKEKAVSPLETTKLLRQTVLYLRLTWRLPPNWNLQSGAETEGYKLSHPKAVYVQEIGEERLSTTTKPPLYCGEDVEVACHMMDVPSEQDQELPNGSLGHTDASEANMLEAKVLATDTSEAEISEAGPLESISPKLPPKFPVKRNIRHSFSFGVGCPPLHSCLVKCDSREDVETLLRDGASPDTIYNQYSPASLAVVYDRENSLGVLLSKGVAADSITDEKTQTTLLHLAARHGHLGIATILIEHGAKIDAKDANLRTPFIEAIIAQQWLMVECLALKGADTEIY